MKTIKFYKNCFCLVGSKMPSVVELNSDCGSYCTAEHCDICRDMYLVRDVYDDGTYTVLYHGTNGDTAKQIFEGTYGIDEHFQIDRVRYNDSSDQKCNFYGSDIGDDDILKFLSSYFSLYTMGTIDVIMENLRKLYDNCCMAPLPFNQVHIMEYKLDSFKGPVYMVFDLRRDKDEKCYIPSISFIVDSNSGSTKLVIRPRKTDSESSIRKAFKKTIELFSAVHAVMEYLAPKGCKQEVLQKRKEFLAFNHLETSFELRHIG